MAQRQSDQDPAPTTREAIHRLVDELPKDEFADARLYLEYLRSGRDPLLKKLLDAPYEDEPETEEERAGMAEAWEDVRAGRTIPMEEIEREFGVRAGASLSQLALGASCEPSIGLPPHELSVRSGVSPRLTKGT